MSADNTVKILHTQDGYRVKHCQAIENIYWWYICCEKPNVIQTFEADISYNEQCLNCGTINPSMERKDVICPDRLREIFEGCEVFKNEEDALKKALEIYKDIFYVEYGIQTIEATHINLGDK